MVYLESRERKPRFFTAVAVSALLMAMLWIVSTAPSAQASERHYCYGVTLGAQYSPTAQCNTAGGWGETWYGYIDAVYGSGDQHSVCVGVTPKAGKSMCSTGPGQGIYNDTMKGALGFPYIENNASSPTKAYGNAWYHTENQEPPPPPSWHSDNLGGEIVSDPDMSSRGNGLLDVFARGTDNHLWHKWYSGNWSSWENLGGTLASGPGAVSWNSERIDVVARATNNSVTHWGWSPGTGWVSDNLGGEITSDPDMSSWGYGRLDVFAKGPSNELKHRAFAGGSWQPWENLGGTLASGPGAVSWGVNRIDVVARGTNNSVLHWAWNGSTWVQDNLGGEIASDPDISSLGSGNLNIFAKNSGGNLVRLGYNGIWSWEWLGWLSGTMGSGPGAVSWNSHRMDVVGRASNGSVAHWAWND
jgi:uncharacterized membrane protein